MGGLLRQALIIGAILFQVGSPASAATLDLLDGERERGDQEGHPEMTWIGMVIKLQTYRF